jgi:phosphohistidine swiveling domain-containing protein
VRSGTAHFTITGAAFTRLVQQRMLDDAPDAAYRLATSIGSGDPAIDDTIPKIAQRLCDGKAALEGDERSMQVVTKAHRKYRTRIAWLHAGRIRLQDRWWQPVAYVQDVGPMDLKNDHGVNTYTPPGGRGIRNRGWHYCGKDEIVVEHAAFKDPESPHLEREVIFRACVERPHWHQPPPTPQAALEEYLAAGRRLERRGHAARYGHDPERWPSGYAGRSWMREPEPPGGGPARFRGTVPNEAMERKLEAEAEASRLRRVADLRELILSKAGDDLIELAWEAKGEVPAGKAMIPRAPFVVWCFARLKWFHALLPEWQPISPSGMKIWAMDDPVHTDWVIGGGFDPQDRDLYWGAKGTAAEALRSRLQDELDERQRAEDEKVTTLVTGAKVTGVVTHGLPGVTPAPGLIIIIPNLHSRYLWATTGAAAVIAEEGGEVAHLAQVAREQAVPVVRAERALERWGEGDVVEVDPEARTVRVVRRRITQPGEADADSGE